MLLVKSREALRSKLNEYQQNQRSAGFVPTMGALHDGHISLINASKKDNNLTVCSIFVNPAQFNNPSDLEKYPVTTESDIQKLESAGCDIVFLPGKKEIYPTSFVPVRYELGHLEDILEGKYRPGHFQGVCQVVDILLRMVQPDKLYLGQKDLQQCKVIGKLLELTSMDKNIELVLCPTLREKDGLAMSSRNMRLNTQERKNAVSISRSLQYIIDNLSKESVSSLQEKAISEMKENDLKVDYVAIVNAESLLPVENIDPAKNIAVLAAAFAGEIRLIDNMVVGNV